MDIVRLRIPYSFIRCRVHINWRDVHFGLANELLDPQAPSELAAEQLSELQNPPAALDDVFRAETNDSTLGLVQQLAAALPAAEVETRSKWLYIVLAWLYEHRDEYPDPLQRVEEVYADFGYPEPIAKFVRYMPMEGPDLGNPDANVRRLFERWRTYLDEASFAYAHGK